MIEQPITIYFDLSVDNRPTLGAVGRAIIEFEKMAGETAFLVEPGADFLLVYDKSATGSLKIVSKIRGQVSAERLKYLAIIIATTLVNNSFAFFQEKGMEEIIESVAGEGSSLTDRDIERIAEAVRGVDRSETVRAPRREFYKAVEQDSAITGVGAIPNSEDERPKFIVPRSEFLDMATNYEKLNDEIEESRRTVPKRIEVVLVQPPLIESNRQWRIFTDGKEFGAKVLDEKFKQQILEGATDLRLAKGIILDVTLETKQEKEGGLWKDKSYSVSEVHSWRQNPEQAELMLSHRGDDEDQND